MGASNDFNEVFRDANIVWKLLIVILHGIFVKMIIVHVKGYPCKVGGGRLFLVGYSA